MPIKTGTKKGHVADANCGEMATNKSQQVSIVIGKISCGSLFFFSFNAKPMQT